MPDLPRRELTHSGFTHYAMVIQGHPQVRVSSGVRYIITVCEAVYAVPEEEIVKEGATCMDCIGKWYE